ncbi:MAG: MMPL family transporter [Candidatus Neomarinimicrobiota bacterium]
MREKVLNNLATFIANRPWWTALILLIITIIMGGMAVQLELTTSFTNLLPEDNPMVDEFNMIIDEYNGSSSMLIVAEGESDKLEEFAESAVPKIEALSEWVSRVDYKAPKEFIAEHGLMLMKSSDLENNMELFQSPNLDEFLTNLNNSLEKEYIQSEDKITGQEQEQGAIRFLASIQSWISIFNGVLNGNTEGAGETAAEAILYGDEYYRSWDDRMIILQILPTFTMFDIEATVASTDSIEIIVHDIGDEIGVRAGLTGTIPLGRDEMVSIQNDSMTITTIALVGILILFIVAFRMLVSPILAIITLAIGVLWALGVAWPLVGSLNLMTSMMAVVLIGLGIDFSVHIISTFTEMRHKGDDVITALKATFIKSGPGIITGGLTTASAFLTMLVARTEGMKEFGLTLGIGIIMTMIAAMLILPNLLVLRERIKARFGKKKKQTKPRDISYQNLGSFAEWLSGSWKFGAIVVLLLLIIFGYRGSKITMDYNYLNMEPVGLESIELQDKMIDAFDISSDFALITAETLDEVQEIAEAAKDMNTAGMVQSIIDYLPPEREQKSRTGVVSTIRQTMQQAYIKRYSQLDFNTIVNELYRLEENIIEIQDLAYIGGQDKVYLKSALLVGTLPDEDDPSLKSLNTKLSNIMDDMSAGLLTKIVENIDEDLEKAKVQVGRFHTDFASSYKEKVVAMANPSPITLQEIPEGIRRQYVGKSGKNFLISIFPKQNVWEIDYLKRFSNELTKIDPRATGLPPIFNTLMDEIGEDGKFATKLALLVIFIVLLIDFRNIKKVILAMTPLIIGVVWMVGVMEITGLQITLLNIMAIPMIIGIGIDDGVHIVHRYQIEGRDAHKPVFASTGRAILLTSITTMLGFGSLWFATYRGLGSMGIALFIGVGMCFFATAIVIPVLIGIFKK